MGKMGPRGSVGESPDGARGDPGISGPKGVRGPAGVRGQPGRGSNFALELINTLQGDCINYA